MGSGSLFLARWARAPRILRRAGLLAAVALFSLCLFPSRAAAQTPACPGTVNGDYILSGNIVATSADTSPCITVTGDGHTINLAGYTIDITNLNGGAGVAIETGTTNNTTIVGNGGQIVTAYTSTAVGTAIDSQGGTNLSISGITFSNDSATNPCTSQSRTNLNYGVGITLNGVTGATVSANTLSCYQTGISVQNSVIPRRGTALVSGNNMTDETFDMAQANQSGVYSAGIVLSNASGWSVENNYISYSGSTDENSTCVPASSSTSLISCSFALQIITGSSGNSITGNNVFSNFSGGIYTGPDTSKNKILSNNVVGNTGYDLFDDAPNHSNAWRKNTCSSEGGNVSPQRCP